MQTSRNGLIYKWELVNNMPKILAKQLKLTLSLWVVILLSGYGDQQRREISPVGLGEIEKSLHLHNST